MKRNTTTGRFRGTTPELDEAARELRRTMTPSERRLWEQLRGHRLNGLGIRRQHPVGGFVLDFACPSLRLAIELDGSVHSETAEQDAARTRILEEWGWTVIRFQNDVVRYDPPGALANIAQAADAILKSRSMESRADSHAGALPRNSGEG